MMMTFAWYLTSSLKMIVIVICNRSNRSMVVMSPSIRYINLLPNKPVFDLDLYRYALSRKAADFQFHGFWFHPTGLVPATDLPFLTQTHNHYTICGYPRLGVELRLFYATFNNISFISLRSVLVLEKTLYIV